MDVTEYIKPGETLIRPDDRHLIYTGRIDEKTAESPELIFPASSVAFRFHGRSAAIVVSSKKFYWSAFAGCMMDGRELVFPLPEEGTVRLELGTGLPDCDHEVVFFKRQDACNIITVHGMILGEGAVLLEPPARPARRIEVYGDSVSAGEVAEAVAYAGRPDPEGHDGYYANSRYSYAAIAARMLHAELHDIAQGGVALLPKTGWFSGPDYVGMEQIYDKIKYYPDLEHASVWDFKCYIPHVVIVAIGQNDANPVDYMKSDYEGDKAKLWRKRYSDFLLKLRGYYPNALIICSTTVLCHDPSWDRAIDEAVNDLDDPKITHFTYTGNGALTPGHIRIPEAEDMAKELCAYIEGFGEDIWT